MDAYDLQFEDGTFDFFFGGIILHRLNMVPALDKIFRISKPNGKILFIEPLDLNPVGKLVRPLTKKARTADEQPLRLCYIAKIEKRFEPRFFMKSVCQFLRGVLSGVIFENPSNSLMRFAFCANQCLNRNFVWLRNWFRHVLISGTRR
jgi:ubiquinone/menaquinone biosynthesis C-methylase UbiE